MWSGATARCSISSAAEQGGGVRTRPRAPAGSASSSRRAPAGFPARTRVTVPGGGPSGAAAGSGRRSACHRPARRIPAGRGLRDRPHTGRGWRMTPAGRTDATACAAGGRKSDKRPGRRHGRRGQAAERGMEPSLPGRRRPLRARHRAECQQHRHDQSAGGRLHHGVLARAGAWFSRMRTAPDLLSREWARHMIQKCRGRAGHGADRRAHRGAGHADPHARTRSPRRRGPCSYACRVLR